MKFLTSVFVAVLLWHPGLNAQTIEVERVTEYDYQVRAGDLRWDIEADTLSQSDPRREGIGQFRLRRLHWTDESAVEHEIMTCGQCNVVESLSEDGVNKSWAGGGHGRDGDHVLGHTRIDWELDTLAIGETRSNVSVVEFISATALYSVNTVPLQGLGVVITIDASGMRHHASSLALQNHTGHTRYEDMLSTGLTDYFDEWTVYDDQGGVVATGGQDPCIAQNSYPSSGVAAEFSSSQLGIDLRIDAIDGRDHGWLIQRRADCQRKAYHRAVTGSRAIAKNHVDTAISLITVTAHPPPRIAWSTLAAPIARAVLW